jgi:hypothetical protein
MVKQVIFIGGTSFSGSTLLDMILANDPAGFSCGEVQALFRPWRSHHFHPECGCGDKHCNIWKTIRKQGENNFAMSVSQLFPQTEFAVVSGKDPFWIRSMTTVLRKRNVTATNILIWKSPMEFAYSLRKRNRLENWKDWINYHRLYFTLIPDWKSLQYSDLTKDTESLKKACEYVGIPYFEGKEQYWNKTHHTLFGNPSAKIHLHAKDSLAFAKNKDILIRKATANERSISESHKSIYHHNLSARSFEEGVEDNYGSDKYSNDIVKLLKGNDVGLGHGRRKGVESLKINRVGLEIRKIIKAIRVRGIVEKMKCGMERRQYEEQ